MFKISRTLESMSRAALPAMRGAMAAAAMLFAAASTTVVQAQHVPNPYAGATLYVNPDYANEVNAAIAAQPSGSPLAAQMATVAKYPTAVWLDHMGAIAGGAANSGRLGLQGHINAALAQQAASGTGQPIVVQLVIYDLPDRDCAALASNGELSIAPNPPTQPLSGLETYEQSFITPIYNILAQYANNPNIRFVLVIEDDSLPNMITNTGLSYGLANCIAANDGESYPTLSMNGVYVQGIQYALNAFHQLPNAYNYLDVGHHGWLGWQVNLNAAVPFFLAVAEGTTAGVHSVDGFITNTANYGPTVEPYMTANESINGNAVRSATFYQYDNYIDEASYAAAFDSALIQAGFPATLGFLIDTSRNGWGGPQRPTGPSSSTGLDAFVNASKIDGRDDMGQWCNQENAGIGVPPTANPGYFANLNAYVWIKPPGESDGNYPGSTFGGTSSTTGDPNCDPAHNNALANNYVTGSLANGPKAGTFWPQQFEQLVQNAYPAIPASTTSASFSIPQPSPVSVAQGATATESIVVAVTGGFNSNVVLSVSGLPAGVSASFSPSTVTGAEGSTLTLTASSTAAVGAAKVTVTGVSGSTTESATLNLTVVAAPNFRVSVNPAALSVAVGSNPTVTMTVASVGGFSGAVALSASGLPAGVSANFSPSSVNGGGSSAVNFFAQSNTPAGTYNVQLVGTSGTVTHSANLALTISAAGSFSLTNSAGSLSMAQGALATESITVVPANGFTGSVSLAVSGLPSGVTAAFGTNPTTGSSVLTFTAGSTAVAGSSTVTVTGTSGTVKATTSISLTVTAAKAASFTLTSSSAALTVPQGATGTETVTVKGVNGFAGSVTLAASGLPAGVTATFGTNPVTGSSGVTFTASSTAVAGTSNVVVTGTSGTLTASTTIALTVTAKASGNGGFACHVSYSKTGQWPGGFGGALTIQNTGSVAISNWTLTFTFANGQTVTQLWNGNATQTGGTVTVTNMSYNGKLAAGASYAGVGFNGTWNNTTNAAPTSFAINGTVCQ